MKKLPTKKQVLVRLKIARLEEVMDWIKADYGTCRKNDFVFMCLSCSSRIVISFLEEYVNSLKNDE